MQKLNFKLSKQIWTDLFGMYKSKFHWTGLEFSEHKEYQIWDNIKNIDWKLSAKTNKIYIKKYEEDKNLKVSLVVDLSITDFVFEWKSKRQILLDSLFLLWESAIWNSDNVQIIWEWEQSIIKNYTKNRFHFKKYLEEFENIKLNKNTKLEKIIQKLIKLNLKNNLIFLFTDSDYLENPSLLKLLTLKNDVIIVNIFHKIENKLLNQSWDLLFSDNKSIYSLFLTKNKVRQYQKLRENKLKHFEKQVIKSWWRYLCLDTSKDVIKEFYKFMAK